MKLRDARTSVVAPLRSGSDAVSALNAITRQDDGEAMQRLKSVLLDSRTSQSIDPIRLPTKLRSRIEKAQRRAAAAKDAMPLQSMHDKIHLPDVILSHKMRDFEAKTSANSVLVDPLDNSLNRLSLEEKERVMQRMQEKIQQITKDIDDSFVRIKDELDANGIFDAAANYHRAQAICLVELQKRCKLERLRDEAIQEIVGSGTNSSTSSAAVDRKRQHRISGKLSQLLVQSNQVGHDDSMMKRRATSAVAKHTNKQPHHRSQQLLPKLESDSANQHSAALDCVPGSPLQQRESRTRSSETRALSRHQPHRRAQSSRLEDEQQQQQQQRRPKSRRDDGLSKSSSHHAPPLGRDEPLVLGTSNNSNGDRRDDAMGRHPHIAHVLQYMKSDAVTTTSRSSPTSRSSTTAGALADTDELQPTTSLEQWAERSRAYQTIAARAAAALFRRSKRQRWDALNHFRPSAAVDSAAASPPALSLPASLLQRLSTAIRRTTTDDSASACGSDTSRSQLAREDLSIKRTHTRHEYAMLQEQIRSRLQREKKKLTMLPSSSKSPLCKAAGSNQSAAGAGADSASRTLLSSLTPSSNSTNKTPVIEARASVVDTNASSLGTSTSGPLLHAPSSSSSLLRPSDAVDQATQSTAAASELYHPTLAQSYSTSQLVHASSNARSKLLSRGSSRDALRSSLVVEQKLRLSHVPSRRKQSLIGAPVLADFSTIGHHSNARMVERRESAQTWMWHQTAVPRADCASAAGHLDERDEYNSSEEDDAFGSTISDDDGSEAGDNDTTTITGDCEIDADVDDMSSVVYSSYEPETARSSASALLLLSTARRKQRQQQQHSKKRSGGAKVLHHQSSSSSLVRHHTTGTSTGSIALQSRLEEIWKALEFPFSRKLLMLEKYAELQDADTFANALAHWERVGEVVLVRERMKAALVEFAERLDVAAPSRLVGSEWMFLRSIQIDTPDDGAYQLMTSQELVTWIRDHMDVVTSRCHKFAHELKAAIGDDLEFQGCAYPPRM